MFYYTLIIIAFKDSDFVVRCSATSFLLVLMILFRISQKIRSITTGCPYAKDPNSPRAGTGGPDPNSKFQGCDGKTYTRNAGGGIPDEIGQPQHRITNAPGTLSMANTGML